LCKKKEIGKRSTGQPRLDHGTVEQGGKKKSHLENSTVQLYVEGVQPCGESKPQLDGWGKLVEQREPGQWKTLECTTQASRNQS